MMEYWLAGRVRPHVVCSFESGRLLRYKIPRSSYLEEVDPFEKHFVEVNLPPGSLSFPDSVFPVQINLEAAKSRSKATGRLRTGLLVGPGKTDSDHYPSLSFTAATLD